MGSSGNPCGALTRPCHPGCVKHRLLKRPAPDSARLRTLALAGVAAASLTLVTGCGTGTSQTQPTAPASPASSASSASSASGTDAQADAILRKLGVAGRDVTAVVETLDRKAGDRQRDVLASVRYDSLLLKDGDREASLAIPQGRFYLSVAPYVERTHECFHHSLTTCTGELAQKTVQVKITDSTGAVLTDGPVTTYPNGFVGFWLPRDITGTLTVTYDGKSASSPIATDQDAPTCLTTLKLA